jgi:uncharacterized protein (TIGR02996 family)
MGEDDFIRAILADPKDNALLLVYSDWLEDQADPTSTDKAEFLRLSVAPPESDKAKEKTRTDRRQTLAATLDTSWLAVVSRLQIENCPAKQNKNARVRPVVENPSDFLCDRKWEALRPTDEQQIRFCEGCQKNVYYCDTITAAREHAKEGRCVAVDLGVIRRKEDLRQRLMWLGRPSEETLRREEELAKPDPVSAERERRKREAKQEA